MTDEIPPGARRIRQPQGYAFWVIGDERRRLRDAYHSFLNMRWSASIALIAIGFFGVNILFAIAYTVVGGVEGMHDSFFEALVFSVQTLGTIGYGVMYPKTHGAQIVMIVESITSIVVIALATGLVFTKFSRATARVAFSKTCVITNHEGKRTLMFRIGNLRSNTIIEAQLRVVAAITTKTLEGETFYKMHDLTLVRNRMAGMRRGWAVMHVLDESSPLCNMSARDLEAREVELEISMVGFDDVTMQTVHAIHIYQDTDIVHSHRFVDTLRQLSNGDMLIDLRNFDATVPDA